MQELLGRLSGQELQALEDASGSLAANSRGYVVSALPDKLVSQVSTATHTLCELDEQLASAAAHQTLTHAQECRQQTWILFPVLLAFAPSLER